MGCNCGETTPDCQGCPSCKKIWSLQLLQVVILTFFIQGGMEIPISLKQCQGTKSCRHKDREETNHFKSRCFWRVMFIRHDTVDEHNFDLPVSKKNIPTGSGNCPNNQSACLKKQLTTFHPTGWFNRDPEFIAYNNPYKIGYLFIPYKSPKQPGALFSLLKWFQRFQGTK